MVAALLICCGLGCSSSVPQVGRTSTDTSFFAAASMHASPVFTKTADFDGDTQLDGIEAVMEIQDRFGDPTKAAGRFLFQVYAFKPYSPDPRGERVAGPFEGRVDTAQDQRNRWSKINRAYIFQLAFPGVQPSTDYVLETMFETPDGRRLTDRLMLEGDHEKPGPTTGPSPLVPPATTAPASDPAGAIVTQEPRRVPASASQPHTPPARADQP